MIDNTLNSLLDNVELLDQLSMQARSIMKFQEATNDSTTTSTSTRILSNIAVNQAYAETANSTNEWMEINQTTLGEIEDLAMQALKLVLSGMPDNLDFTSLREIKIELESILYRAVDLANFQIDNTYIFAGTNKITQPFTLNGPPFSLTFIGDDREIKRNFGPGEWVIININVQDAIVGLFNSLILGFNVQCNSELERVAEELQISIDTLKKIRTINGVRQKQVLAALKQCEETDFLLRTLHTLQEDGSIVEAITNLQQQEVTYQAVSEVACRTLVTINLFDLT